MKLRHSLFVLVAAFAVSLASVAVSAVAAETPFKGKVKAVETVDACVGRIVEATLGRAEGPGSLIITADHGNAEQMWDSVHNCPHTSHTTYDVPLIVVGEEYRGMTLRPGGRLADIAPTVLAMMGLPKPDEMTGRSLFTA